VNKTPGALLCTALTSILRMNKTRSVRHLAYVYLPPSPAPFPASLL